MSALLEVRDLVVRFGGLLAIENASFEVREGELLGLIGPNGAGKTTMLRSITGVVRPKAGRILLDGRDIGRLSIAARVRRGLGLSQQIVRPFRGMSVLDNVMLAVGHAKTRQPLRALTNFGRKREALRAAQLLSMVGIDAYEEVGPSSLPLGVLKRLEVARALALEPRILLLDEPLAGLNSHEAGAMADTIRRLRDEGLTIVLIEHNLSEVLRIVDRLVVLDNGRVIGEGEPRAVMTDPTVRAAYLGTVGTGEEADGASA